MLKTVPLSEEHLEDAARLVSRRYQRLREQEPHLPRRFAEVNTITPLLQDLLGIPGAGVAAIRRNRLVGFLTGWHMSSFRGKKSTFSLEWANGADLEESGRIYEEMYSTLAAAWGDRSSAHYIGLFPNDIQALRAWHWLGFGMIAVDAIRGMEPIGDGKAEVDIRRARPEDIEAVMDLHEALRQYMKGSPTFLLTEKMERNYYEEWLGDPSKVIWLAYLDGEPVAFMRLGPADENACTIIVEKQTTSIYAAFTKEKVRNTGIAIALLNHALKSARESGYGRCAVSFEPMNLLATRFWMKYFKPVCYWVVRHLDERLTQAGDPHI